MLKVSWGLFLDDVRTLDMVWPDWSKPIGFPSLEWVVVRSYTEAIALMKNRGCPDFMSFDHDLELDHYTGYKAGVNGFTGMDVARWMVERDLDSQGDFIPPSFGFYVHSANPVGAENIRMLLDQYLNQKEKTHV